MRLVCPTCKSMGMLKLKKYAQCQNEACPDRGKPRTHSACTESLWWDDKTTRMPQLSGGYRRMPVSTDEG